MLLVDTHSHLFLEEFEADLAQVIERARTAGITHIFMPNIDRDTILPMLSVAERYKGYCFPMIGLHPTSVDADYRMQLDLMEKELSAGHGYIAVGEVGLDLYWSDSFLKEQEEVFARQLEWALHYGLPVVIHCRDAFEQLYRIMEPYKSTSLKGVFHSFTGTVADALQALEYRNFYLGINGVVTFKKSHLPQLLKENVPLNRILLETDSPYLAPTPHRGKRNETAYIVETLRKVAEVYGLSPDVVAEITSANALNLFRVP